MSFRSDKDIERRLRAGKPEPQDAFLRTLAARADVVPARTGLRFAFAGALTAVLLASLAAVGGLGYAASSVTSVVKVAKRIVAPAKSARPLAISAGGDQYRPGYGFGDPNHNHAGPPGLKRVKRKHAPPLRARHLWPTAFVTATFTIDEQAHLTISVIDTVTDERLLITQNKSKIGGGISGPQTKAVQYAVLVPRKITITLGIPRSQLVWGHRCLIVIAARDPDGNVKKLEIPFIA